MYCYRVPTADVPEAWPHVAPLLQRALDQTWGEYEIIDIFDAIIDGRQQLHVIGTPDDGVLAAATTEVVQYPRRKALRVHLLGGSRLNGWRDIWEEHLMSGALAIGADQVEFIGRPGWARYFRPDATKRNVREVVIQSVH